MPKLIEIFWIFLKLGCSSFGGPAAHLVFFKHTFVEQKHWLNEQQYSQLLALTQLLPGPSSSQMGMAIGYLQRSYLGAVVAWIGFTLPSALLMFCFALLIQQNVNIFKPEFFSNIQAIILAIIIFAFWQMFKSYCKTKFQFFLMCLSTFLLLMFMTSWIQFAIILGTGFLALFSSYFFIKHPTPSNDEVHNTTTFQLPQQSRLSYLWLIIFITIFIALWVGMFFSHSILFQSAFDFYKTGALVFGGGHVVLPMLQQDFVNTGLINHTNFELGYMLAQFMPGPLFTFASYIGAFIPLTSSPIFNALLATCMIFLPSFFFIFTTLPYWSKLLGNFYIQNIVTYINAAVVGFILSVIIPMAHKTVGNILDTFTACLMLLSLYFKISIFLSIPVLLCSHYLLSKFM